MQPQICPDPWNCICGSAQLHMGYKYLCNKLQNYAIKHIFHLPNSSASNLPVNLNPFPKFLLFNLSQTKLLPRALTLEDEISLPALPALSILAILSAAPFCCFLAAGLCFSVWAGLKFVFCWVIQPRCSNPNKAQLYWENGVIFKWGFWLIYSDVRGLECQKITMIQTTKLLLCVLKGKGKGKGLGNLYFSPVAEIFQVMKQQPRGWGDLCRFRVEGTSKII